MHPSGARINKGGSGIRTTPLCRTHGHRTTGSCHIKFLKQRAVERALRGLYIPRRSNPSVHRQQTKGLRPRNVVSKVFTQSGVFQGKNLSSGAAMATEPLVRPSTKNDKRTDPPRIGNPVPDSQGNSMLQLLLSKQKPSRVVFLRKAYMKETIPDEAVDCIVQRLRTTSIRQFDSVWRTFLEFVHKQQPEKIDVRTWRRFLTSQFLVCKRAPGTIKAYESALDEPYRVRFGISLTDSLFADLILSFERQRPARRTPGITWSRNEVFELLIFGVQRSRSGVGHDSATSSFSNLPGMRLTF